MGDNFEGCLLDALVDADAWFVAISGDEGYTLHTATWLANDNTRQKVEPHGVD